MPEFITKLHSAAGKTAVLSAGQLANLANNALVLSAAIDNAADKYPMATLDLVVQFGTAPTANTDISVWVLREVAPGGGFEFGDAATAPARPPDAIFPLAATTAAQQINAVVTLPDAAYKVLLKNNGSGQALAATGNLLEVRPFTYRHVSAS